MPLGKYQESRENKAVSREITWHYVLLSSREEELKSDNSPFPDQSNNQSINKLYLPSNLQCSTDRHFLLLINVDVLPKFLPFL